MPEEYAGHYTLIRTLGHGGAGQVYLGFDNNIKREVAIKELFAERAGTSRERMLARFIREAEVTGQLEHPGVVPVYEMGEKKDGTPFYVMKYVSGKTLFDAIKSCEAATPEEALKNRLALLSDLIAVCEAVGYAHSRGIVHRDLKPSNIIIGEFGEAIILDWGLAKAGSWDDLVEEGDGRSLTMEDGIDAGLTRHGDLMGTPSYMAPEQIDPNLGQVDPRTDVYALGVILYMILTGEKPYGGGPKDILREIVSDNASPSPARCGPNIPPELIAICEKAMLKDKTLRFKNATELAKELKAYRDGRLVSVYAYSKGELFRRFLTRNKVIVAAAAAVVLSILVGAGLAVDFAVDAHRARLASERALVDVTGLSEQAMKLSRDMTAEMEDYFNKLVSRMRIAAISSELEALHKQHPEAEGFAIIDSGGRISAIAPSALALKEISPQYYSQIINGIKQGDGVSSNVIDTFDGHRAAAFYLPIYRAAKISGLLAAVLRFDKIVPTAISFDPLKSAYQIWCMQGDGYILYDEDPVQVGKYLFTDSMYAKFPELLALGERIRDESSGIGLYRFYDRGGAKVTYKIAAWNELAPFKLPPWKVVVTYPYRDW